MDQSIKGSELHYRTKVLRKSINLPQTKKIFSHEAKFQSFFIRFKPLSKKMVDFSEYLKFIKKVKCIQGMYFVYIRLVYQIWFLIRNVEQRII